MSGLHEVTCGACGKRHVMSAARARSQRVLRCDCGQFVRLDRALSETRSDPPPPPAPARELSDGFDDEETHMLSSLEDVAALRPGPSHVAAPRSGASHVAAGTSRDEDGDSGANRVASSAIQPPSVPPPRASVPVRRSSSPTQPAAGTDKPLWYVDLGGTETIEMTIEQLILARRSGKLGEGALVWRAGMPRWRPIGSLIPAAGSSAPRHTPQPGAVRPKPALPDALGSYERPLATLEFALEKPAGSPPREPPAPSPSPTRLRPPSQPPAARVPTPVPGRPTSSTPPATAIGPLPTPTPLPGAARKPTPTPLPPAARLPGAMMPLLQRASPTPPRPVTPLVFQNPWRGHQPRWGSIAIAVLICVAASGSGAFLVRALKIRRQPLSLSPTQLSAAPSAVDSAPPVASANSALPPPASSTEVVDVDSLSVERHAPRALVKPAAQAHPAAPATPANLENAPENAASDDNAPPVASAQPVTKPAKAGDLPAAAQSNPYTTGAVGDDTAKKPVPTHGDEPGF